MNLYTVYRENFASVFIRSQRANLKMGELIFILIILLGPCKVWNETETKRNETDWNETNQNKTKQIKIIKKQMKNDFYFQSE